ncbi:hypothetical protein HanHA300_Chr06g0195211 [Helianthus annuus]|nr:hypothetical protein HanHA300_Chr06g0195211 [Helianthus annuus]KAJ0571903.1 hypothetical protein HanHA89_Chr06g0210001 [Helianthus annuus]KAJ0736370.1 hypothetical protein HanLR1_Chr06g0195281 [Helianthus annuus]
MSTTGYYGWVKKHQNWPLVTSSLSTTTITRWPPFLWMQVCSTFTFRKSEFMDLKKTY